MINYSLCAVRHTDTDAVLDLIEEYLAKFDLHLVEERIGDRSGKYVKSPQHYSTLEVYNKELYKDLDQRFKIAFQTAFTVFEPLPEHPLWTVLFFQPYLARLTPDINARLASFLSKQLKTITFEYKEYSVVDWYVARRYNTGVLIDEMSISDGQLDSAYGFFAGLEEFKEDENELYEEAFKRVSELVREIDYKFSNKEHDFLRPQRRPMYIKGAPEKITDYLKQQQIIVKE